MSLTLSYRIPSTLLWVSAVLLLTAGCQGEGSYQLHLVLPDARAQSEVKELRLQAIYLGKVDGDAACADLIAGTLVPPASSVRAEFSGSLDNLAASGLPLVPALDLLFFVEGSRTVGLPWVPILRGCTPASVSAGATVEVTVELAWICDPDGAELPANQKDDDCDGLVDECLGSADCEDLNPCTDDACGVDGKCAHANNRAACDDGFYCTTTDACAGGSCFGIGDRCPGRLCDEAQDACADCLAPADCDDQNPCTDDACASGGCTHVNNTEPCDDGMFCTDLDSCQGGACQGSGNPCGLLACDEATDSCRNCQQDAECDDHNPCTDDSCAGGQCDNTANDANGCADGLFCTATDACVGGSCQGSGDRCPGQKCDETQNACVECLIPADCDDTNPCTDDTCPDGSCAHAPNTAPCNDGFFCTATDTCAGGICGGIGSPCGAQACDEDSDSCKSCQIDGDCDDANPCTDDACPDGSCTHTDNTAACNDGLFCTLTDACSAGGCLGAGVRCPGQKCDETLNNCVECLTPADCDDQNLCTDDGCADGSCTHLDNADGCDDGLFCTATDTCAGGACQGAGDPCPAQICDETLNACVDCQSAAQCDDANPCTTDTCPSGSCVHADNTAPCDDGLYCTQTDTCAGGACVGAGNPCGAEACNEDTHGCGAVGPTLLAPPNGFATGSPHAPVGLAVHPLKPEWIWLPVGTAEYEIQIDDSCQVATRASCSFPSPEHTQRVATTRYRPTAALPVAQSAPVGTRYYWRVRGCDGATCTGWSEVRYLDVGRLIDDFNGDGYSDVVGGAPGQHGTSNYEGAVFVYHGSASGIAAAPTLTLADPGGIYWAQFGLSVSAAGDLNADGYADLVVGAPSENNPEWSEGNAFVYLGGPDGLPATPSITLDNPIDQAYANFGLSVAGAGDLDGDGYADLVVGAPLMDAGADYEGNAFVYYGGASGVAVNPDVRLDNPTNQVDGNFGNRVASAGDLNADGYGDLVVGAYTQAIDKEDEGAAFVYLGGPDGIATAPSLTIQNPASQVNARFGSALASACDLDADGYGDLAVSSPKQNVADLGVGRIYVYLGGPDALPLTPSLTIENPAGADGDTLGWSMACADLGADGFADLVVGAPFQSGDQAAEGFVFLYKGAAGGPATAPTLTIENPGSQAFSRFGWAVAIAGDVSGDGYGDLLAGAAHFESESGKTNAGAVFFFNCTSAGVPGSPTQRLDNPTDQAYGEFGSAVAMFLPLPSFCELTAL